LLLLSQHFLCTCDRVFCCNSRALPLSPAHSLALVSKASVNKITTLGSFLLQLLSPTLFLQPSFYSMFLTNTTTTIGGGGGGIFVPEPAGFIPEKTPDKPLSREQKTDTIGQRGRFSFYAFYRCSVDQRGIRQDSQVSALLSMCTSSSPLFC
jgi:hypothetical protein